MKKKNVRGRSRGAVTVFLTLILVPCMVVTCVFGDVSRVALSKSQAAGASDLALYSLMSHYDEDLKEWYGLVASCQSIEEFYDVSEQYFVGMMDANGLDGTASNTLVSYLDAARNGDFANFLQLDGLDSVEVRPVDNGTLGDNPALIEDGIVEFMKYRGPVVIVSNLVERFKKMDMSGLTDAEKNEPIVEAKQEYAKAEGEMMEDLLHTYLAIERYMDYRQANQVPVMEKYQNEYGERLSLIYSDFPKVTDTITKYYAATDGIKDMTNGSGYGSFPLYDLPDTNNLNNEADAILYVRNFYTYTMEDIGAEKDEDGSYHLDDKALNKLLEKVDLHIQGVQNAAQRIVTACNGITAPTPNSDINPAVYCMRMQNAISGSDLNTIHNDGKALMQQYAKLILAQWCDFPEGTTVAWSQKINDTMQKIEEIHTNYLTYLQPSSDFERLLSQYRKIAHDNGVVENVIHRRYEFYSELCGRNVTVGGFLEEVKKEFTDLEKHLDQQISNINVVLDGGWVEYPAGSGKNYEVVSLSTLKTEIINYSNARDTWGNEANSKDTKYAKSEQNEYKGVSQADDLPAALYKDGAQSVEVLRTRLVNIRNDMQTLKDALTNCTYGGKKVDTLDRNQAISAARTVVPTTVDPAQPAYIALSLSQNASAAQQYHQQLMQAPVYTPPSRIPGESGNEPDLGKEPDIPELYRYMQKAMKKEDLEKAVNKTDNQKKKNEENQEKANGEADKSKGMDGGFLNDLGVDPKEISGSESFGAGTLLTGLVDAVKKILDVNFDEFRDEMYVCTYIMEMFSYSSYNNEGQYNLSKEPLTLEDYDKSVKAFRDTQLQEKWKEEAAKFTHNKSLTNQMINSQNNRSNLAEVEYILFGKATNKENLEAAYGNIFAIRESLNLVSGFANFYTDATITAIAEAVMAATMGIIPVPVTKVALIGLMATLESAHDLSRLKAGTPVVIYKKKSDWVFAITSENISDLFSKDSEGKVDKNGVFYSDYMLLFLMISANNEAMYSDMLLRVGDLIEGNVAKKKNSEDYDLEKAQCYFRMTGDLSVKPLLLKLPLVTNYNGADASQLFTTTDWCSYSLNIVRGYS